MKRLLTVVEAGRLGGLAGRGLAKDRSLQMKLYWSRVRAGELPLPRPRGKARPKQRTLQFEKGGTG